MRGHRFGIMLLVVGALAGCGEDAPVDNLPIAIVPRPVKVERRPGVLALGLEDPARRIHETTEGAPSHPSDEAYVLEITEDGIVSRAKSPRGHFYARQTLKQLMPLDGKRRVPCCRIEDHPRFAWRGMHLDVCRHFFEAEEVKHFLDLMALYKLNTFHWHLTEDQGWRIEIKKYPKLTEVGAFRAESPTLGDRTKGDGVPYGGFYTQDEIRDVVAYAKARFITVVPEIEMPGHAQAAVAAYPELGNTDEKLEVRTRWGVSRHVYNVEDETFAFLEDVLDEVLELFPSTFIHIGGDECPKDEWKSSEKAQARMKAEGLADEHALQSWFIRRIETYLSGKGRRLIGWDEIQEGGLAPGAAMMVWRSVQYGIEAAKAGHDVVMSPTSHAYFDYYQGDRRHEPEAIGGRLPLERVYGFEPVPTELTEAEAQHILGGQGNLWSEYIPTFDHLLYMAFPRGAAMAEVLWSPAEARDYADFLTRWQRQAAHFDAAGLNHRRVSPRPVATLLVIPDAGEVSFHPAAPGTAIRYTLDGTLPSGTSAVYDGPIRVAKSLRVTAAAFSKQGRPSAPVTVDVVRWDGPADPGPLEKGLRVRGYRGGFDRVPDFETLEAKWEKQVGAFGLLGDEPTENFALRFEGWLRVDAPGAFTFRVGSDDGSVLRLAGATLVSNDGLHGFVVRTGQVHLEKGLYPIELGYFEKGGGQRLEVEMEGPGSLWRSVTEDR